MNEVCTCVLVQKIVSASQMSHGPKITLSCEVEWKWKHSLVQNKVEVKSSIAGRPCLPPVMDLSSAAAGHQDHHEDTKLQSEQALPAPALGHHSRLDRKHQLDPGEGKNEHSPGGVSLSASHAVKADVRGMKCSSLDQSPISLSCRCVPLAEEEWSCWLGLRLSAPSLSHTQSLGLRDFTQWNTTCVTMWFTVCTYEWHKLFTTSFVLVHTVDCFFLSLFLQVYLPFYTLTISAT